MRISVLLRTLNEEKYIADFCRGYAWADDILLADGGSSDRTLELAAQFGNVSIRHFEQKIYLPDGSFYNNEPKHINFLVEWGEELGSDWLVIDDCDCWPNRTLQSTARAFFNVAIDFPVMQAHRLYMWGTAEYFPKISEAGAALWGWQPRLFDGRYQCNYTTRFDDLMVEKVEQAFTIKQPAVLLHYWRPKENERKYASWGKPQTPIEQSIYWPPEPVPEWAFGEVSECV